MDEKIIISHAYNGFIYLPIFIASYEGYFPHKTELHFSNGDENSIREVLNLPNKNNKKSHFAVCDPLIISDYESLIGEIEVGEPDPPIIVGSMIQRTPIWLFNTTPNIVPVPKEESLKHKIDKIRCYEKPNTGYLVGKKIQTLLNVNDNNQYFKEVKFNTEFDTPLHTNEVVVTSNILRMAELGFNNNNIVFSYASKQSDIKNMFFTGIITRKTVFEENLPAVLAILSGIKRAIEKIYNEDLDRLTDLSYEILKDIIISNNMMSNLDENNVKSKIKISLTDIIRKEHIYSDNLVINRDDWETSINLRKKIMTGWEPPSYDVFTEKIPVILIHSGWYNKISLKIETYKKSTNESIKEDTKLKIYHNHIASILTLFGLPFFFCSIIKFIKCYKEPTGDLMQNYLVGIIAMFCFFILTILGYNITKDVYNKNIDNFNNKLSWWATIFGITLAIVFSGLK